MDKQVNGIIVIDRAIHFGALLGNAVMIVNAATKQKTVKFFENEVR